MDELNIEDIIIGQEFINCDTGTISTVISKTSNSIEMFNRADRNNRYLTGEKDASGEIQMSRRMKGIDCKQFYTIQSFRKKFILKSKQ